MLTRTGARRWRAAAALLSLVLVSTVVSGCFAGCGQGSEPASTGTGTSGETPATGQAISSDIPPGREIAEGGGGPKQYTFREEWRRGLAKAHEWRPDAYLISAVGDMINNEGVPSSWTMCFIDKPADTVLVVEMDPWGAVTRTREVTGDGVKSFVTKYTKAIPYDVIDSDRVVTIGTEKLAATYDMAKTKDPRVGLNFSVVDGSGPYWNYTVFSISKAEYASAQIDAMTGEAQIPKQATPSP